MLLAFCCFFRNRPLLTGMFAGLAILSRPEGLLVAALLAVSYFPGLSLWLPRDVLGLIK